MIVVKVIIVVIILPVVVNRVFITGFFVIAGFALSYYLLRQEKEEYFVKSVISVKTYKSILATILLVLTYMVMFLELQHQMNQYYPVFAFRNSVYGIFNFAYLYGILMILKKMKWEKVLSVFFYFSIFMLFIYVIYYQSLILQLRDSYFFNNSITLGNFNFHYLAYPFILAIIILLYKLRDQKLAGPGFLHKAFSW